MNIEQAKFCAKFDAETTKLLFPSFNVDNFEIMKAWSEGARVDFQGIIPELGDGVYFSAHKSNYKILPETHIVNGIECPAPLRIKLNVGEEYFFVSARGESQASTWADNSFDKAVFSIGNCFDTRLNCDDNAKAHYPALRGEE